MIIGNGLIANTFKTYSDNQDVLIFASGVSHSKSDNSEEFLRERKLLKSCIENHDEKLLVYFSTYSVLDPSLSETPYVRHKLLIEELIKKSAKRYLIIRASNIVGPSGNPNTIFNFMRDRILNNESIEIWNHVYRNFLDVEDLYKMVYSLIEKKTENTTVLIANTECIAISDFVSEMETFLGKPATKIIVNKGSSFIPDLSGMNETARIANIEFGKEYIQNLFVKYLQA